MEQSWSGEGALFDPETPGGLVGAKALSGYISSTHEEMPGLVVALMPEPEIIGNRQRVGWMVRQNGVDFYTGTDFIEFAADGRISRRTIFATRGPSSTVRDLRPVCGLSF